MEKNRHIRGKMDKRTDVYKQKKTEFILLTAILAVYMILNGILLVLHEPWRDEANVWLMARELTPFGLLREIKYQGHPCLWYLLLMPFAKAGLPFRTLNIVSYMVMAMAAGLFLYKAPFHKWVKAIVLFSPIFTYYYAVIARNYCLIALLLVLLAVYYPERNNKCILFGLLLGLLVQSDVIALMTAGSISCFWLGENLWQCCKRKNMAPLRNILKGIWIPLCSLFLLIAQFYSVSDSPMFQVNTLGKRELFQAVKDCSYQILERLSGRSHTFCFIFFLLTLGLMLLASFRLRNVQGLAVMAASYLFQAAFSAIVYGLHIWHFLSLCFVLIWAIWIMYGQKGKREDGERITGMALGGIEALLVVLAVCMFTRWNSQEETSSLKNALYGSYSDGGGAAEFIRENISPDELIVSVNVPLASSVIAYLPEYDFYFAGNGRRESYADWSESQSRETDFESLLLWAGQTFPEKTSFFLLNSNHSYLKDPEGRLSECEILYQTGQETAVGEEYIVYRIEIPKSGS